MTSWMCQEWLKDRNGRELIIVEIEHYQKITVALVETDRIMKEIGVLTIWFRPELYRNQQNKTISKTILKLK